MRSLKISVWIMAIIGAFLAVGSLISSLGIWEKYYSSWIFILMVMFFTVVLIWCLCSFRFSVKKIGFYLCHIGLVVIIICSFISWSFMRETSFAIPINSSSFYGEVMQDDGSELNFGFEISIASFEVEKYDPEYRVYNDISSFSEENILIDAISQNRQGIYNIGKYGEVSAEALKKNGEYIDFYRTESGLALVKLPAADKSYSAELNIKDAEDIVKSVKLSVNEPYTHKGWKFYLMGYDETNMQYVNIYAKNDPSNIPFAIGIWITIVGTFLECIPLIKRKED